MYEKQIQTMENVKDFFKYLAEKGQCFHPDDSTANIGNMAGGRWKNTFTTEEVKLYDKLMVDCFIICSAAGVDIYDLMMQISDSV